MPKDSALDRDELTLRIKTSLRKAEKIASGLRKTNTRLLVSGISASGISTLVAGLTATQGPLIGAGVVGWRVACMIAAVFALISTLTIGLTQQLRISDRAVQGTQCVGRLRSLEVTIATGSHPWDDIAAEYEDIARTYPELIS